MTMDFWKSLLSLGDREPSNLPIVPILTAIVLCLQIIYWILKNIQTLPDSGSRRKARALVARWKWLLPVTHTLVKIFFAFLLITLAYRVHGLSVRLSDVRRTVLPEARNDNIRAMESSIAEIQSRLAATPTPTVPTPPVVLPPASEYKLIWYNHFESNVLYEVLRTDPSKPVVRNDEFRGWCQPFIEQQWVIQERYLVAADEEFKSVPGQSNPDNWWTNPTYKEPNGLPRLLPSWLHIMDDERWYVYKVIPSH